MTLDTGAWPEHPSYQDHGFCPRHRRGPTAMPRICDFGDNPLTPANDPFVCNHKLISGQPFLDTYIANNPPGEVFPDSARDSNGHGSHTSTTAAGDQVASAKIFNIERGPISGLAPGAHIAVYKVCGLEGCFSSDSVAAVGQAITDGVDVINFSIGGGAQPTSDPVEIAFLDAYAAGVFVSASAGNYGPDRRDGRAPRSLGHDGRSLDPATGVPVDADPVGRPARRAAAQGRIDHHRHLDAAAGR